MKTISFGWFADKKHENREDLMVEQEVAISMKVMEEKRVTSVFFLAFIFTG